MLGPRLLGSPRPWSSPSSPRHASRTFDAPSLGSIHVPEQAVAPSVVRLRDRSTDAASGVSIDCTLQQFTSTAEGQGVAVVAPIDTPVTLLRADIELSDGKGDEMTELDQKDISNLLPALQHAFGQVGMLVTNAAAGTFVRGALRLSADEVIKLDEGEHDATDAAELLSFTYQGSTYTAFGLLTPLVLPAVRAEDVEQDGKEAGELYELAHANNTIVDDDKVQQALATVYEHLATFALVAE